jgi:hypothetical protein
MERNELYKTPYTVPTPKRWIGIVAVNRYVRKYLSLLNKMDRRRRWYVRWWDVKDVAFMVRQLYDINVELLIENMQQWKLDGYTSILKISATKLHSY